MAFAEVEMEGRRERMNPLHESSASETRGTVADELAGDISKLNRVVVDLRKMLDKIGTKKDTMKLRKRLKKTKKSASATYKSIKRSTAKLKKSGVSKAKLARISKDLSRASKAYDEVTSELVLKERQHRVRKQESERAIAAEDPASKMEEGGARAPPSLSVGLQENQNLQIISDVDLQIMREREQEAEAIQRDAVGLHELTQDLATMVTEQGEALNVLETNVESTRKNVQDGIGHLEVANDRQKAYRKKLWIVLCCGILIVVAILVPTLIKFVK